MGDSPWLSDRQQQVWRSYIAMSAALDRRIERSTQDSAGMPHAYYLVLAMLSEAPDRTLRMSSLADQAQMSQSRLSHAVSRLEESGWVVRSDAPDDKRGHLATLTDAGWDRLVAAAPQHAETVRSVMFDGLTDEQLDQLGVICDLVLDRAEKPA
jgi:DNA-binding MarR family transcriptional regulator